MASLPSAFHVCRSDSLCPSRNSSSFPSKPVSPSLHRPFIVAFSYKPKNGIVGNDEKRDWLKQFGLNPDDFLSEPSAKIKRRNIAPLEEQEPKPPRDRETHKLLQANVGSCKGSSFGDFAGKDSVFDYISVIPPYMQVDYAVLMDQISNSSVVGENTFILVEYPLRTNMLDSYSCLMKIADRRFGRTHLAIWTCVVTKEE